MTEQTFPLTSSQLEVWIDQTVRGNVARYIIGGYVDIFGAVSPELCERAVNCLADKHEALRIRLEQTDSGIPVQRFVDRVRVVVPFHDLCKEANASETAYGLIEAEMAKPLDLYRGAMFRVALFKVAEDRCYLSFQFHHLVVDGWSIAFMAHDLGEIYSSLAAGSEPDLKASRYRDFVTADAEYRKSEAFRKHRLYWLNKYKPIPDAIFSRRSSSGTDRDKPRGEFLPLFALPRALSDGLATVAGANKSSLLHALLAGLYVSILRCYRGQELVVGLPILNRSTAAFKKTVGLFMSVSAARLDFGLSLGFVDLLHSIGEVLRKDYRNQKFPISELNREIHQGRRQLFEINVSYERHNHDACFGGARAQARRLFNAYQDVPLNVSFMDYHDGENILVHFGYNADYFERAEVERIRRCFITVLESAVRDPGASVDTISLLQAGERQRLLEEWNATSADYPQDKCLHELFAAQVARTPDAVAVVFEAQSLSYGELNARANRLAHHLIGLGVKPDDRVALCMERSVEMVVGLLAVLKAGGAYVPLDPTYPAERLASMLADSAPRMVLAAGGGKAAVNGAAGIAVVDLVADADRWAARPGTNPDRTVIAPKPEHLAYVLYTSGSTGRPKGVLVEHRQVVAYIWALAAEAGLDDVSSIMMVQPLTVDSSVTVLYAALLRGGTLHLMGYEASLDAKYLAAYACRHEIDCLKIAPPHLQSLMDAAESEGLLPRKLLIVGGDVSRWEWMERVQAAAPGCRIFNHYGPTETTVGAIVHRVNGAGERGTTGSVPIGRPLGNSRAYILDGTLAPVPIGVAGDLYLGGAQVTRGYLGRPDLTCRSFIADPFAADGSRLYRTGDRARHLPDGTIEFLGRGDEQVKIRGYRIEPEEVGSALLEYAGVRQAVVMPRLAGQERILVAYVVLNDGVTAEAAELRRHLSGRLPDYMVPAAYVRLDALPLTPHGKLDRKALPAPEGAAYVVRTYEAPQGEIEERLAAIWAELLQVERVGRHDNFFELGGHSLLAVTLVERMRSQGLQGDVRAVFEAPTVAGLAAAAAIGGGEIEVPANLIPAGCARITPQMLPLVSLSQAEIDGIASCVAGGMTNIQDIYPLAPLQEGVLFHHLMGKQGDAYLMSALLAFDKRARLDSFVAALQAVIGRHDILRTAVLWEGLSEPVQVVSRAAALPVEEIELDAAGGDAARQLRARIDVRSTRMDVRRAPLLRVLVAHDRAKERWLLLLLHHHLVMDHTTLEVLTREVQAHVAGRTDQLPVPVRFRNFVGQARLGVSAAEHEAFFREMLADVDEPVAPFGLLNVQGDGSGIEEVRLALAPELARRLREQARLIGVSAASLFHTAWGRVVAATSGRADAVFGTVLLGRMQGGAGVERTPGMFINTLPIRIAVGAEGAASSVRRVHRLLTQLLRHEHAALVLAQRCSGVPAPAPLFTSVLNYRHSAPGSVSGNGHAAEAWQEGIELLGDEERNNYPVTLSVDDLGDGFMLTAQTEPSVGAARLCGLMLTALEGLAEALEREPAKAMSRIEMLGDEERRRVVEAWNATSADYPYQTCVHELFAAQAERTPDATAVVFADIALSYAELNARANRLAHHLIGLGVKPDERVAICVERSVEMVVGLLAVLKAGGAYVPLDPAYPVQRLAYMLFDSAPRAVLADAAGRRALGQDAMAGQDIIDLDAAAPVWASLPSDNPDPRVLGLNSTNLAYVIYTSGSTGRPKGVSLCHRNAVAFLDWAHRLFGAEDVTSIIASTSICFDVSVFELFAALCFGKQVALASDALHLPENLLQGTVLNTVPSAVAELVRMQAIPPAVEIINVAGEPLSPSLVRQIYQTTQVRRVYNLYGPSEATIYSTCAFIPADAESAPIGRPISNTQIYILDAHGAPAPIGVPGELYIGGAGLARGYLNRPVLTAERFVPNPFAKEPGSRMYRTGDLARWRADGVLEFLGRNDDQVKLRGYRIELGEIEARLAEHPGVREAIVVAREDDVGGKRLVAYYRPEEGEADKGEPQNALSMELVSEWSGVFDRAYDGKATKNVGDGSDFRGWISSYTGSEIPPSEMHEWQADTLSRIRALQPRRVLELGSGTGIILSKVAPDCETYIGTEISKEAILRLEETIRRSGLDTTTRLIHAEAADFTKIADDHYDTVILNSVVQYFPGIDYLVDTVRSALSVIRGEGRIFIGDVRHHQLLEAFHLSVQLHRSPSDLPVRELKARIARQMRAERELLIDPAFFHRLRRIFPDISQVEILPKSSAYRNEMSAYRYDVVLHVRTSPVALPAITWDTAAVDRANIEQQILQSPNSLLGLRNIRNPLVYLDALALRLLKEDTDRVATAGELQQLAGREARLGITSGALASFCAEHGYAIRYSWFPGDGEGGYHALISKTGSVPEIDWLSALGLTAPDADLGCYGNHPLRLKQSAVLQQQLRAHLASALPEYMVPSAYVALDALPLTPNGKLDRKALPAPEDDAYARRKYEAPQGPVEEQLAAIWCELLQVERVGRHDNFFELGGHSLLAVKLVSAIKQRGSDISLAQLFAHPTVELLARSGASAENALLELGVVPLRTPGKALPLFLVHDGTGEVAYGLNLTSHIGTDIPVYGLTGERAAEACLRTVQGMASRLVRAIRAIQPVGPYRLAGWSFGGMLAYEIAAQLMADDGSVEFLGLIDTYYWARRGVLPVQDLLRDLAKAESLINAAELNTINRGDFATLVQKFQRLAVLPEGLGVEAVRQYVSRYRVHIQAGLDYQAHPISVPIHLFTANEGASDNPLRGWGGIVSEDQIHLVPVPGNHYTMMKDPCVASLGAALSSALRDASKIQRKAKNDHRSCGMTDVGALSHSDG